MFVGMYTCHVVLTRCVCRSFRVSLSMLTVLKAFLMSKATVIMRAVGGIWMNVMAFVLLMLCSAVTLFEAVICVVCDVWKKALLPSFGNLCGKLNGPVWDAHVYVIVRFLYGYFVCHLPCVWDDDVVHVSEVWESKRLYVF